MPKIKIFLILLLLYSSEIFSVAIQEGNQPEIFDNTFKMTLDSLPKSGQTKTIPWSDTYWPTYRGGISYRWNKTECPNISDKDRQGYPIGTNLPKLSCLSPSEKFDLLMGDKKWTLTNYERNRTEIMKTIQGSAEYDPKFKIPGWEGICHAWAPASIAYEEPSPGLLRNPEGVVVPFGSADIKALLAFGIHLESPIIPQLRKTTMFAGTRCSEDFKQLNEALKSGKISRNEFVKRMNDSKCTEDINAGSFHIILTNQIGLKDQGFVIDMTRDAEVWNQPIFAYEYQVSPYYDRIPEGSHVKTQSLVKVTMKVKMVMEIDPTWNARPYPRDGREIREEKYEYLLELGANGLILGGKWISENRPDFVWKKTKVDAFQSIITLLKPYYEFSISDRITELAKLKKIAKRAGFKALADRTSKMAMLELYAKLFAGKKNFNYYFHKELYDAVKEKRKADIKKLTFWLRHGATPDFEPGDEMGVTNAIMLEDLEILKMLVEAGGTVKNTLPLAMEAKNVEILKYVLKNGADIDVGLDFDKQKIPALHLAVYAGDVERVKVLLDFGFTKYINWVDDEGENAIFFAFWPIKEQPTLQTRQIVSLLIGAGIDVNKRNGKLYTPLAVVKNYKGPFASLIERELIKNGGTI
ncbi:MAG: ankyrin repeat domain-containing protein [Bacteriovoracales bacterium]